jgi:glycosyltransferase involved in cell wall biosynthesis
MRVLLRRNPAISFGQDIRAAAVASLPGVEIAERIGDRYHLPCEPHDISLLITFNCDHPADAELISGVPQHVPVVVHYQLQPSFLDPESSRRARLTLQRAASVIVPAAFLKPLLQQQFGVSRIVVIRNGVDSNYFQPKDLESRTHYRATIGLPSSAIVVAWVAQATAAKGARVLPHLARMLPSGVYLLLRSFSRKRTARDNGLVPELDSVTASNPAQVRVQPEDWTRAHHPIPFADSLLITSLSEVAPLVASEALMSGVPIISTDCTPFYDELERDGLDQRDVSRVPLAVQAVGRSRKELDCSEEEAMSIAQQISNRLAVTAPVSSDQREYRACKARSTRMSMEIMLREFGNLYDTLALPSAA